MACCKDFDDSKRGSQVIDKQIKAEKKRRDYEVKLLLLGAGESGKSTFAKQMKILHMNGFDAEERLSYKAIIYRNIYDSIKNVITACRRLGINLSAENQERALRLEKDNYFMGELTPAIVEDCKIIWADPGIREAVSRANEFQFLESTIYFMENIDRIGQEGYNPTDHDILRSRSQTCGIIETRFSVEVGGHQLHFRMCDVAGQRSERRKWMHCFSDVKAVIVLVGLSEYDQVLAEQAEVNRMHEAQKLFGDIANSRWFEKTTMILFLNKMDLFAQKIKRVPLTTCFPEYTGPNTFEAATQYIAEQFRAVNRNANKLIYTHLTCATDTECIKSIFSAVKDTILQERLSAAEY